MSIYIKKTEKLLNFKTVSHIHGLTTVFLSQEMECSHLCHFKKYNLHYVYLLFRGTTVWFE